MNNVSFHTTTIRHQSLDYTISYFIRPSHKGTILYLHGLGSTKHDFLEATQQHALYDFTIVALDLPGTGNSSYAKGTSVDDLVELTNKFVTNLQLEEITLIGHSMGGLIALLFTQKYPQKVKRLVSVEGNLAPEDCGILSRTTASQSYEKFVTDDVLTTFEKRYAASPYHGSRVFADTFRKNVTDRAFHDYCVSIVAHSDSSELLSVFTGLDIRRLFLHASANRSLSYIRRLSDQGVEVVEIPESDHWMYVDNRNAYYNALAKFVTSQQAE